MGLFDDSIGPFVIGTVLACFLSGVTSSQAFQYYQNFEGKDRRLYKYLVLGLFILDLVHTGISISTIWNWCVENYGNVENLVVSPWSFAIDPFLVGAIAFTCQSFYAYRVYIVGKHKLIIPIVIVALSSLSFGFAIASTQQIFYLKEFARFQTFTWGVSIWLCAAAAADVLITASLVYYLKKSKTGLLQTNSILNRLIEMTVSTNGITCSVAILDAVLFGSMNNSAHVAPNLILPKLYYNSLLVSLNARIALERRLIQSNSAHGESHGLAELSPVGPFPANARGGKIRFQNFSQPVQGIQVPTHHSIVADGDADSTTFHPSETTSSKDLGYYPHEKEDESSRSSPFGSPFGSEENHYRIGGNNV
ncbi:hypothetical protein JCM16303_004965 [Sporobolomyces ruberrimus]